MSIQGLITGSLSYELRKEFLGNSFEFRKVETFNYEINSADFLTFDASIIQNKIKDEFNSVYKGDINVKVFSTQNSLQFPSDSIRSARFNVSVEVVSKIDNDATSLDKQFLIKLRDRSRNILNFREEITFAKNQNGNREFNHSLSFGIRDNENNLGESGRKTLAQTIASELFETNNTNDYNLSQSIPSIVLDQISDVNNYKNYFSETYDLIKNTYSFAKKREILPFGITLDPLTFNVSHSLTMSENGIVDVTEKASSSVKKEFNDAVSELENYYLNSYIRCLEVFNAFHNTDILLNERGGAGQLSLINIPIKLVKNYNKQSLTIEYDVSYTSNPQTKKYGNLEVITSETIDFVVDAYNKVEATHSFDYTFNKTKNPDYVSYVENILIPAENQSKFDMQTYYENAFPQSKLIYPTLKLIKSSNNLPNIKTKSSSKYIYSNNPTYLVEVNGIVFKIYEVTIDVKKPVDIVNEYKIINRPSKDKKAILSYAYQSEKGEVQIKINATVGKNSRNFYENTFNKIGEKNNLELKSCLESIYQDAGQRFLSSFNTPSFCLNWFISDSNFSFDSDNGTISAAINYVYTSKLRYA